MATTDTTSASARPAHSEVRTMTKRYTTAIAAASARRVNPTKVTTPTTAHPSVACQTERQSLRALRVGCSRLADPTADGTIGHIPVALPGSYRTPARVFR